MRVVNDINRDSSNGIVEMRPDSERRSSLVAAQFVLSALLTLRVSVRNHSLHVAVFCR